MVDDNLKKSIWRQFGATIDYLADTITACPDDLWLERLWDDPVDIPEFAQFWYRAYHTLFWLNLYLTGAEEGFVPPPPFELIEQDDDGPIPQRPYTKDELLGYLNDCRDHCRTTIEGLTDETIRRQCHFSWGSCSFLELLIYNLRHVQEHAAQLNLLLGQRKVFAPDYKTQIEKDARS